MTGRTVAKEGAAPLRAPRLNGRLTIAGAAACAFAALVLVLALTTHRFLTWQNIKAILSSASLVGIEALGLTFVTMVGGVVSLAVAEVAVVTAMAFLAMLGAGLVPALAIAMALGAAVSGIQGFAIGAWNANPVMFTISAAFLIDGVGQGLNNGQIVQPAAGGYGTLNATPLGVPVAVYVLVGLALALQFVTRRTVLGRQIMLVGENRPAARAAGLPITRVVTLAFAIAGIAFGIGGAFLGSFNAGASVLSEGTITFDAIAAVLVGGTSITGGHGSPLRTLAGSLAIAAITDVLLLRGFSTGPQVLLKGMLVVVVVVVTQARSRGRR
ncbi:MAG TPA: ABC transporter permease [Solirubrobacteraceae bacterium]|nr:ABC transporter permease [Solirubrobacteraceae bacterium]